MPKTPEFATWVSNMAGTIEDRSIIEKQPSSSVVLNDMQKRKLIADMLVPLVHDEDTAIDWVHCFCVGIIKSQVESLISSEVIGRTEINNYYEVDNPVAWIRSFKKKVLDGWQPGDL